jgi:hypothetical protein
MESVSPGFGVDAREDEGADCVAFLRLVLPPLDDPGAIEEVWTLNVSIVLKYRC